MRNIRLRNAQYLLCLVLLWGGLASPVRATPYDVIICGKGGEKEYEDRFADWGARLQKVLVQKLGHPAASVTLLAEPKSVPRLPGAGAANLETLRATLQKLSAQIKPDDDLLLYLIGHGSYQNGESKFNMDGPDLSAPELKALLAKIPARAIVVINAASSSAGFINVLSGAHRIICAATKSTDERNATEFMEYFIQGLEDQSADQDRDSRISVLEACQQAAALTQAGYTAKGLILTEHALLDDDGDGLGTRLPLGSADDPGRRGQPAPPPADPGLTKDSALASGIYLKDFIFPPGVPPELVRDYRAALIEIDALKGRKTKLATADYTAQLEALLIKAARINREIHRKI